MGSSGDRLAVTRRRNTGAFEALGASVSDNAEDGPTRVVRTGNGTRIFTVGYERRSGEELLAELLALGIEILVDVREKPISRKPDFRRNALEELCRATDIQYVCMNQLGSPKRQREALRESGDFSAFRRKFLAYARRNLHAPLKELGSLVRKNAVALLCYERRHEDCHRSIVADLVATQLDGTVVAID